MDIYVNMSEFVSLAHVIYSRMPYKIAGSASGKEMSHQNGVRLSSLARRASSIFSQGFLDQQRMVDTDVLLLISAVVERRRKAQEKGSRV
jgi:hypothetical protein